MTDHLPECQPTMCRCCDPDCESCETCICDRLRACEQRVRSAELAEAKALLASRDEAWFAAVEAARDAVAAIPHWDEDSGESLFRACDKDDALAAIDALKEDNDQRSQAEGVQL